MVRLLHVGGSNLSDMKEITSNAELSNVMDAIAVAEKTGDGRYIVDYGSGQYQVINISDNRVQQFDLHSFKNGSPASELDNFSTNTEVNENTNYTEFGALIPSNNEVGTRETETTTAAVEEFE